MSNLNDPHETTSDSLRAVRVAERAGAEHLGASLYELQPGDEMVFHYHVQREELLIVLSGRLNLRTADGWEELPEGEVVAFPRGECGAHGYRNDADAPVRLLMISEMNGPNISVYPDNNQVGVFDAGQRSQRRFGALFNVADAVADYGGKAEIVPPAPGPRARGRSQQRSA
ncbi:MAG TPA: cupin domain-containing protein [Gaiellaceae bacterium]|nr:cupin domain-containing protein [Gaiellaceae bacterium]